MSKEDWYRNETWNEEIEAQFMAKLNRARRKEEYLRIQASTLTSKRPEVALELLNQYFESNDSFDRAQAYCDKASAYEALGKLEEALDSYKLALNREKEFPRLLTEAYIDFPMLVVQNNLTHHIVEANEILDRNKARLIFPVDHFRWHATKAIIEYELGNKEKAYIHSSLALDAVKIEKSGFRYHQNLGLVDEKYKELLHRIRQIYAEQSH